MGHTLLRVGDWIRAPAQRSNDQADRPPRHHPTTRANRAVPAVAMGRRASSVRRFENAASSRSSVASEATPHRGTVRGGGPRTRAGARERGYEDRAGSSWW